MRIVAPLVQSHKNLVVVRVGDGATLHPTWLNQPLVSRNWDLLVSYYGLDPFWHPGDCEGAVAHLGQKWPAVQCMYRSNLFDNYDYIWFPDVDIKTDTESINRLFELVRVFGLDLAQPALALDSYSSHNIVLQHKNSIIRYTNFVEIMVPVFSQNGLAICAESFDVPGMGWGLDYVWPKLLAYSNKNVGIIDAVSVTHTVPAGSTYDIQTASNQMWDLMNKYQVDETKMIISSIGLD